MTYISHRIVLTIACIITLQACCSSNNNTGWFDWFWNIFGITYNTNIENNLFTQQKGNSIIISNTKNMNNPTNIQLTGITQRVAQTLKINSISLPSFVQVIIDNSVDGYIECDTAFFDSGLEFVVENGKLTLKLQKNTPIRFKKTEDKPLCTIVANLLGDSLHIAGIGDVVLKQASSLRKLTINGASKIYTTNNNSGNNNSGNNNSGNNSLKSTIPLQTITALGASIIDISNIATTSLQSTISGASTVTLTGTADTQKVIIEGASKYNTRYLKSKEISIVVLGTSNAAIWATDLLTGSVAGVSTLQNYGPAISKISTAGLSSYKTLKQ